MCKGDVAIDFLSVALMCKRKSNLFQMKKILNKKGKGGDEKEDLVSMPSTFSIARSAVGV